MPLLIIALLGPVQVAGTQPDAGPQLPPVEIEVLGADLTLFPTPQEPAVVTVRARKHVEMPCRLQIRAVVDNLTTGPTAGYRASEPVLLEVSEVEQWVEARIAIFAEQDAPSMTTGKLLVRAQLGDQTLRREAPLRIGRGALCFLERRSVTFPTGPRTLDLVCLENPLLRAEIVPEAGCVCTLMSHRGRRDMLVAGDYPLGFLWAGLDDWYHRAKSLCGASVQTELSTRSRGGKIYLRASLGETDGALTVEVDARELSMPPGPLYVMATRSGDGDRVLLPCGGPEPIAAPAQPRRVDASMALTGVISLWNAVQDETLQVAYSVPTLRQLEVGSQAPWYDYVALHLADAPPQQLTFRLAVLPGRPW